ncbi:MAG: sigma-70 family RNA polymerase sigma factor [Ruminococcus sp.]|nr:sigma-70 family RNA polymerase sigma factor [Ruminococcus sp.]
MEENRYAGLTYPEAVQKYAHTVLSTCVMRLKNLSDSEDCTQETFLKLYTKSPEFNDESHLKAWLLRVALNECRHIIRDRRFHLPLEAAENLSFPSPEDKQDISLLLMDLPPKYREVIWLYYGLGYKSEEIASILGKNPNTVRTLLKRGREMLKRQLGGESDE